MKRKRPKLPGVPRRTDALDELLVGDADTDAEVLLVKLGEEDVALGAAARLGEVPIVLRLIRRPGKVPWNLVAHHEDSDGPELVLGLVGRVKSVRAVREAARRLGWHEMGLFVGKPQGDGTWSAR